MKRRELSACAALAAVGSATTEIPLRVHINAALNVGATREEILETLVDRTPYTGYRTSKVLGWWMRGLGRPNPFFDDHTKAPLSAPRLFTTRKRAALDNAA